MKVAVICVLIFFVSIAFSLPTNSHGQSRHKNGANSELHACSTQATVNLKPLLEKYMALIDFDDIEEFINDRLVAGDPDAARLVEYLRGPDAHRIVNYFWDQPAFTELIKWHYANGLTNIYNKINEFHTYFGWKAVGLENVLEIQHIAKVKVNSRHTRSIGNLLEEFMRLIPVDRLINLTLELIVMRDEALEAVVRRLKWTELAEAWFDFKALPEVEMQINALRDEDVPIDDIIRVIESIWEWNMYSIAGNNRRTTMAFNLHEAWGQIVAQIDTKGLQEYWMEFQELPCGQKALHYVREEEFGQLVTDFYAEQQFLNVMNWAQSHGLDNLFEFITQIHAEIGTEPPPYPRIQSDECTPEEWVTIRARLSEIFPQEKLSDTLHELFKTDESVQALLQYLASDTVESAYHDFRATYSFKIFVQKLRDAGFHIDELIAIIEALNGWDNRPRVP